AEGHAPPLFGFQTPSPHVHRAIMPHGCSTKADAEGCMRAVVLSVGSELLDGFLTDTNATFLAQEMAALGIELVGVSHVGDALPQRQHGRRRGGGGGGAGYRTGRREPGGRLAAAYPDGAAPRRGGRRPHRHHRWYRAHGGRPDPRERRRPHRRRSRGSGRPPW